MLIITAHTERRSIDREFVVLISHLSALNHFDHLEAPASVSIWFAGVLSTDLEPNGVTLSESQLHELADPNRVAPLLQCKVLGHSPQPAVKFKWTFV